MISFLIKVTFSMAFNITINCYSYFFMRCSQLNRFNFTAIFIHLTNI